MKKYDTLYYSWLEFLSRIHLMDASSVEWIFYHICIFLSVTKRQWIIIGYIIFRCFLNTTFRWKKRNIRLVAMLVKVVYNKTIEIKRKLWPHATNTRWDQIHRSEFKVQWWRYVIYCDIEGTLSNFFQYSFSMVYFEIRMSNIQQLNRIHFWPKNGHFAIFLYRFIWSNSVFSHVQV